MGIRAERGLALVPGGGQAKSLIRTFYATMSTSWHLGALRPHEVGHLGLKLGKTDFLETPI